jgi:hypothetical protein
MPIVFVFPDVFVVIQTVGKIWRAKVAFCVESYVVLNLHHPPPPLSLSSIALSSLVLSWFAMPKVDSRDKVGGKRCRAYAAERWSGGMEGLGGGASALLPRCIHGLALYALAALIRTAYVWALCHPSQLTALAIALAVALLALRTAPRDGIVITSGLSPPPPCKGQDS